jgi:hypothetical protein
MLAEVKRSYGQKAVDDIVAIEERMKKDWQKIYNEDGHDKQKLFMLKVYCFLAAACIVAILYINGIIRQMSEAL